MWNEQKQLLQSQLAPNEQLLWFGQPRSGMVLRANDIFVIPFSLVWGGSAFFILGSVLTSDGPILFKLFTLPFVIVALYLLFGRFILDAKRRSATYYGITNERIIIVSTRFGRQIRSLDLRALDVISLNEKSDGSGTITFGLASRRYSGYDGTRFPGLGQHTIPEFEMIQNAKSVYETVMNAQRKQLELRSV
jgi:hypothetical protein